MKKNSTEYPGSRRTQSRDQKAAARRRWNEVRRLLESVMSDGRPAIRAMLEYAKTEGFIDRYEFLDLADEWYEVWIALSDEFCGLSRRFGLDI